MVPNRAPCLLKWYEILHTTSSVIDFCTAMRCRRLLPRLISSRYVRLCAFLESLPIHPCGPSQLSMNGPRTSPAD
jgi:hypothetical protein